MSGAVKANELNMVDFLASCGIHIIDVKKKSSIINEYRVEINQAVNVPLQLVNVILSYCDTWELLVEHYWQDIYASMEKNYNLKEDFNECVSTLINILRGSNRKKVAKRKKLVETFNKLLRYTNKGTDVDARSYESKMGMMTCYVDQCARCDLFVAGQQALDERYELIPRIRCNSYICNFCPPDVFITVPRECKAVLRNQNVAIGDTVQYVHNYNKNCLELEIVNEPPIFTDATYETLLNAAKRLMEYYMKCTGKVLALF